MDKGPVLILSPHIDDVAFSLGDTLLSRSFKRDVIVFNIFSRRDYSVLHKNRNSAWLDSLKEEENAARHLQYLVECGDLLEAGVRGYKRLRDIISYHKDINKLPERDKLLIPQVRTKIRNIIKNKCPSFLLIPLSLLHVDHMIINHIGVSEWITFENNKPFLVFYEDLPYCVDKTVVTMALNNLSQRGIFPRPCLLKTTGEWRKREVFSLYPSQIGKRQSDIIDSYGKTIGSQPSERVWYVSRRKKI